MHAKVQSHVQLNLRSNHVINQSNDQSVRQSVHQSGTPLIDGIVVPLRRVYGFVSMSAACLRLCCDSDCVKSFICQLAESVEVCLDTLWQYGL